MQRDTLQFLRNLMDGGLPSWFHLVWDREFLFLYDVSVYSKDLDTTDSPQILYKKSITNPSICRSAKLSSFLIYDKQLFKIDQNSDNESTLRTF